MLAATLTCTVVALVVLSLRVFTRIRVVRSFGKDVRIFLVDSKECPAQAPHTRLKRSIADSHGSVRMQSCAARWSCLWSAKAF